VSVCVHKMWSDYCLENKTYNFDSLLALVPKEVELYNKHCSTWEPGAMPLRAKADIDQVMSTAVSSWKVKLSEKGKAALSQGVPTGDFITQMNGKLAKKSDKRKQWENYFAKIICETKAIDLSTKREAEKVDEKTPKRH